MYRYCIEKSEIQKKGPLIKNGSHFENFWGCLQICAAMFSAVSTARYIAGARQKLFSLFGWLLEGFVLTACKKKMLR